MGVYLSGRTGVFCVSAMFPPILSLFFGSDLEMSHYPLAIQWPPMSMGTLLTDSLAQGWAQERAGLSTSQSNPVPPNLSHPCPLPGFLPLQHVHLSLWSLRSCHLGYAIPIKVGDRGPHLQGLTPPKAPLFLLKGTDCHLGAGTCTPQPLAPQRPGVDRATGHGRGARAGETMLPEARAPSPPLAYATPSVGPWIKTRPAELSSFLIKV